MESVQLLGSRVLVDRAAANDKSAGGIYLPGKDNDQLRGTVVAVGPGRMLDSGAVVPMTVQNGDVVLFDSGTEITVEGKKYVLMFEKDVMLILKDKAAQ